MTLKGNSCIPFEYDVYLLNYAIKIKKKLKNQDWAFEVYRFLKNLKNLEVFKTQFYSPVLTALHVNRCLIRLQSQTHLRTTTPLLQLRTARVKTRHHCRSISSTEIQQILLTSCGT